MAELTVNIKNKRRIWVAVMFSLIMPGVGQVYCGKLARGLVLNFLNMLPLPIIIALFSLYNSPALMPATLALIFAGGIVQLIAIIDSAILAKRTHTGYQLKDYNRWYVYVLLILIVTSSSIGSTLYLRDQSLEAFRVPVGSMYPTIGINDRILANKRPYKLTDLQRGDIVIFNPPNDDWQINYIKRVVAIAGDTVERKNDQLYINGQKLERKEIGPGSLQIPHALLHGTIYLENNGRRQYKIFLADRTQDQHLAKPDFGPITVPHYHAFVLGDNRNLSSDSRGFGSIALATINGRADYIYWPAKDWSRFGKIAN